MTRLRLASAGFVTFDAYFEPFDVEDYQFTSVRPRPAGWPDDSGLSASSGFDIRSVRQTGYVEFAGRQQDSILFQGGVVGGVRHFRKKKLIDDVLLLACLVTGRNWWLYSRRMYPDSPAINANHLSCVAPARGGQGAGQMIDGALQTVRSKSWRTQFEGGFHLRMLRNHANILTTEARFLGLVVIWEWLFAHIRNPSGASVTDESYDLNEILVGVLEEYFPGKVNGDLLASKCIFYVLRNQLAHCGRLPIDRDYAQAWMKQLQCDFQSLSLKGIGVIDYIVFFQLLTQVIVLKTLGLDVEDRLGVFSFSENLAVFLQTGKISYRCR